MIRYVIDLFFVSLAHVPYMYMKAKLQPYKQGFFCGDQSLMYPYKDSTITSPFLTGINMLLPLITIIVIEVHSAHTRTNKVNNVKANSKKSLAIILYQVFSVFFVGYGTNESTTELLKFAVGRPRPHFIHVCRPNIMPDCFHHFYNGTTQCLGSDLVRIKDARKSFPSGHASSSMYSMAFATLYLHCRPTPMFSSLPPSCKILYELGLLTVSLYISATRISDHKHHWGDVIAGILLGATYALISANFALNLVENLEKKNGYGIEVSVNHKFHKSKIVRSRKLSASPQYDIL